MPPFRTAHRCLRCNCHFEAISASTRCSRCRRDPNGSSRLVQGLLDCLQYDHGVTARRFSENDLGRDVELTTSTSCAIFGFEFKKGARHLTTGDVHEISEVFEQALITAVTTRSQTQLAICLLAGPDMYNGRTMRIRRSHCGFGWLLQASRNTDVPMIRHATLQWKARHNGRVLFSSWAMPLTPTEIGYHSYMEKWAQHDVLRDRLSKLERLHEEHGFSDLSPYSLPPEWKQAHGANQPRLFQSEQVWPQCPPTDQFHKIIQQAIKGATKIRHKPKQRKAKKQGHSSGKVLGGSIYNNADPSGPCDARIEELMEEYASPSLTPLYGLQFDGQWLIPQDSRPHDALSALGAEIPYPVDWGYDFNITPQHTFCDVHVG